MRLFRRFVILCAVLAGVMGTVGLQPARAQYSLLRALQAQLAKQAQISGIKGLQNALMARRQLIAYRCGPLTGLSNGTDTNDTYRVRYPTVYAAQSLILVYANWYCASGSHELDGPNNIDVRASVEDPTTTSGSANGSSVIPVYFQGRRTVTIEPGALAFSDPIPADVPANYALMVRSNVNVSAYGAGAKWPTSGRILSAGQGTVNLQDAGNNDGWTVGSDQTTSGTVTVQSGVGFGPIAILGVTNNMIQPAVLFIGDSIANATGDAWGEGSGALQSYGWIARGLSAAGIPWLQDCVGGETAQTVAAPVSRFRRMELATLGVNSAIIALGANDLASRTAAQIEADLLTIATACARCNLKVYVCTITPHTTSTDGWQTAVNQTPAASESVRVSVNTYLRTPASAGAGNSLLADGQGIVTGIIDPCVPVEVNASNVLTQNGGRWKTSAAVFTAAAGAGESSSGTTLTDTRQSWTTNAYTGMEVYVVSGTGAGSLAEISKNTATTLTLSQAFGTNIDSTSVYSIGDFASLDGTHPNTALHQAMSTVLTAAPFAVTLNGNPADFGFWVLDFRLPCDLLLNPKSAIQNPKSQEVR